MSYHSCVCVYGGHYGSEGKGSFAEHVACLNRGGHKLVVCGENSPNSGHTCTQCKTRNIPASSHYGDVVLRGPDSVVDMEALIEDAKAINSGSKERPIYIHRHAALFQGEDSHMERDAGGVVDRISSTGSGSGYARFRKQFHRVSHAIISDISPTSDDLGRIPAARGLPLRLLNHVQYMAFLYANLNEDWLFECSQGALLDVNWGIFPFVTSRTTLPRVAIERNGLGGLPWMYAGVFRTYPIRTGGPSGPTGGPEMTFAEIGVEPEIASVTKRLRRVFRFDAPDFMLSVQLARPDIIAFTHLDYLKDTVAVSHILEWLESSTPLAGSVRTMVSVS